MKFNWGHGIALFYTLFAGVLLYFVIKSTQYDHSLVVDNYYEEDLNYQQHYDKLANSKLLEKDVVIFHDHRSEHIKIQFPKAPAHSRNRKGLFEILIQFDLYFEVFLFI